jgi:hypothetical protein
VKVAPTGVVSALARSGQADAMRMTTTSILVLAVLAGACLLAAATATPDAQAAKTKKCGTLPAYGGAPAEYRIKVTKGTVSCKTARRVLRKFLKTNKRSKGWDCRNGDSSTSWSEACGSPYHSLYDTFRDKDFKKVIKAYYRLDP